MSIRGRGYGQFCPVARAAEVLTERWSLLVIRELLAGSTRFNDLQRGVPLMSPSLLSRRLKELEASGVVERRQAPSGRGGTYHPTPACEELAPMIDMMGTWGQRWIRGGIPDDRLDPILLMWDIRRSVIHDGLPDDRRTVVGFHLRGVPSNKRLYWLVINGEDTDLCITNPGFEMDLNVTSHVRTLTEVWLGHRSLRQACRQGDIELEGPGDLKRSFPKWFSLSGFAGIQAVKR